MKKTLSLALLLSVLGTLPTYGLPYTLDDATGYTYVSGGSWVSSNMSASTATDGTVTITSGSGNFGSGYNFTIALTLDLSKLTISTGSNQQILQLGNYWGLGVNTEGKLVGTWSNNGSLSYGYSSTISLNDKDGTLTLLVSTSNTGTTFMDSNLSGGSADTLRGSAAANSGTITVTSYAADAVVGMATWNKTVSSSSASKAMAYNSLAAVTGTAQVAPSAWQQEAFVSSREDSATSIGRVTFIGDSITEGICDQTWRYQLFKNLVDNGIEFEIAGLREGYYSGFLPVNPETEYGGVEFENSHLGTASGRTYGLINNGTTTDSVSGVAGVTSNNVPYGYTIADAAALNSNTYIMLMGTNDLLSDTKGSAGTTAYAAVMQNLLGGEVRYENESYIWTAGSDTGNMGTLLDTLKMAEANDTVYLMTIPTWNADNGTHGNHDTSRTAVEQYNGLLKQWVDTYNASHTGANVQLVDINDGLVDVTTGKFQGVATLFRSGPGDGIHPNEQGSLIIASNLAHGMGLAGRTAGQVRLAASEFSHQAGNVTVGSGQAYDVAADCFQEGLGYTISFDAVFGDGAMNGWSATDVLSISSGNGSLSGTLNITEGYIKWGQDILFSRDMSQNAETIRISYITGDKDNANLAEGYYVWLDDKLIGQGLQASASDFNGLSISSTLGTTVNNLAYTNGSYAPTTELATSPDDAYTVTNAPQPIMPAEGTPIDIGIDFDGAGNATPAGTYNALYAVTGAGTGDVKVTTSADMYGSGQWFGGMTGTGVTHTGDIAMEITGGGNAIFGVVNTGTGGVASEEGKDNGNVTIVLNSNSERGITAFSYNEAIIASVIGGFNGSIEGAFTFVLEKGRIGGDIIGGYYDRPTDNQSIGSVNIIINGGSVNGNIYGGSITGNGNGAILHDTTIQITGGDVDGSVYGGGRNGTIGGSRNVAISGGTIHGHVYGGDTTGMAAGNVTINGGTIQGNVYGGNETAANVGNVTIEGNNVHIDGTVSAEHVTLRNLSDSGKDLGMDTYSNTISASKLTLDDVKVSTLAADFSGVGELAAINGTRTNMTLGDETTLTLLTLGSNTSLGIYKAGAEQSPDTAHEVTVTVTGTLTAGAGATLNANLVMESGSTLHLDGTLTMGSTVKLVDGTTLEGSILDTLYTTGSATLFSGVDEFYVNGLQWAEGDSWSADTDSDKVLALFTNLEGQYTYGLSYAGGNVVLVTPNVPEPATATLSLLALAALAARRRRK